MSSASRGAWAPRLWAGVGSFGLVALVGLALASGCGEPAERAALPTLAAGVAMTIGGVEVHEAEVEALADALALSLPASSRSDLRRRVLVDTLLPRTALALAAPAERAEALAQAQALAADLAAGRSANLGVRYEGALGDLDLCLGAALLGRAAGDVVGPVEGAAGTFHVVVVERPYDLARDGRQTIAFSGHSLPYHTEAAEVGAAAGIAALDGLAARFASDDWRDLLPIAVLARLDATP